MLSRRVQQAEYLRSAMEALALVLAFGAAFLIRASVPLPIVGAPSLLSVESHMWLPALAVPLHWVLSRRPRRARPAEPSVLASLRGVWLDFLYLALLLGTAIFLLQVKSFSRAVFFLFLLIGLFAVAVTRLLFERRDARPMPGRPHERRVLIIGANHDAYRLAAKLASQPRYGLRIVGHLAAPGERPQNATGLGTLAELGRIVDGGAVDEVVVVLPPAELLACEPAVAWCEEVGVPVHLKIDLIRTFVARSYPTSFDGIPMLTLSSTPQDPLALLLKRTLDVLVAGVGLVLAAPLMLAVAVVLRLSSPGPVLFAQERIGMNGRVFRLYKFRSMHADAERRRDELARHNEVSGPVFKMKDDPRVTPVGRWLRKFSIDELPQLWNVLQGDMSLVGPRPPLPAEVRSYERWQRRRLSMKPGITCLWQVRGRSEIGFEEWMRLDLEYIDNWSLALDLKILLRTVPAVVLARGAR